MKFISLFIFISSLVLASDIGFLNPALTTKTPDSHSIKLDLSQKIFTQYHFTGDNSTSTANKESYADLYYVSNKIRNNGRVVFLRKRDPAGININWNGPKTIQSGQTFFLRKTLTHLGYAHAFEKLSIYLGLQEVSADAKLRFIPGGTDIDNSLEGKGYGFLASLSYSFKKWLFLSVNYQEKIDIQLEGMTKVNGDTNGTVSVLFPSLGKISATLFWVTSKSSLYLFGIQRKLTSDYSVLDPNYSDESVENSYGNPSAKNWKDIMIYSLGHQHTFNKFKLLGLISYAEDPAPDTTRSFGTPAGESMAFILKSSYAIKPSLNIDAKVVHVHFFDSYSSLRSGTFSSTGATTVSIPLI
jgi:long-subunit fatty acid transport protein